MAGSERQRASERVARWLRVGLSLRDEPVRTAWMRSEIASHDVSDSAAALDLLCWKVEQAEPRARELVAAVVGALRDEEALSQSLREEAAGRSLLSLGRLLRRPLAREAPRSSLPRVPDYGTEKPLSLGERKALARRPDRRAFDRLLVDPHPLVIRNLLANPKMTEDDVVRLAARRTVEASVMGEVLRSPRWSTRARVRMAVVLNPVTAVELSLPLLRLLSATELRLVAEMTDLPALLRSGARELLDRRPPSRVAGAKGLQ